MRRKMMIFNRKKMKDTNNLIIKMKKWKKTKMIMKMKINNTLMKMMKMKKMIANRIKNNIYNNNFIIIKIF